MKPPTTVISIQDCPRRGSLEERLAFAGITNYFIFPAIEPVDAGIINAFLDQACPTPWKSDARAKNQEKILRQKCCWLSHHEVIRQSRGSLLVVEDDIEFSSCMFDLDVLLGWCETHGADIIYFDNSNIEGVKGRSRPKNEGLIPIDTTRFRIWNTGCYFIRDCQSFIDKLHRQPNKKVYDKNLIDAFQVKGKALYYSNGIATQNKRRFKSQICV